MCFFAWRRSSSDASSPGAEAVLMYVFV